MLWRSRVQISAPYTGWDIFSVVKIVLSVWKDENKGKKRPRMAHCLKTKLTLCIRRTPGQRTTLSWSFSTGPSPSARSRRPASLRSASLTSRSRQSPRPRRPWPRQGSSRTLRLGVRRYNRIKHLSTFDGGLPWAQFGLAGWLQCDQIGRFLKVLRQK